MLRPVHLTVRGFRGFSGDESFDLRDPAIIFSGGNHCGKSSTLNALEWCLFGDDCKGKPTNIRERIDWVIPNQHLDRPEVLVELRLDDGDAEWVVRRKLQQQPKKKTLVEDLDIETADGEIVSGAEAKHLLVKWLRSTFKDFSTTVYQHQETIRGVLTQEPRDRNDAIDRLLGLSDYRNFLGAVADADPKGLQRAADQQVEAFEGKIATAIGMAERQLEQGRRDAESAGILRTRLNESTVLALAAQIGNDLRDLATEFGHESSEAAAPVRWQDVLTFEKVARSQVQRLRAGVPEQGEQTKLYQRKTALSDKVTDFENFKRQETEVATGTRDLDRAHGSWKGIGLRQEEIGRQIREIDSSEKEIAGRQKLLVEAVDVLDQCDPANANRCPVCDQEATGLLPTLRDRLATAFGGRLENLRKEKSKLRKEQESLAGENAKYGELDRKQKALIEEKRRLIVKTGELLERELTADDDPVALLKAAQEKVVARLDSLKDIIEARQSKLTAIDTEMDKLRCLRQVLEQEDKLKVIEQIKQSEGFRDLEDERDRIAEFVGDLEAVKQAISTASTEEARRKLAGAEGTIDRYFRKLANNPAVKRIVLQVKEGARGGSNSYSILDQDGQDLTPILSQGDLNALALAIFLGLASAGGPDAPMGFLMLDDPSQSLGTSHKRNLVAVLDEVGKERQVLVATMDQEFSGFLDDRMTKKKTKYVFDNWTPESGPSIRKE